MGWWPLLYIGTCYMLATVRKHIHTDTHTGLTCRVCGWTFAGALWPRRKWGRPCIPGESLPGCSSSAAEMTRAAHTQEKVWLCILVKTWRMWRYFTEVVSKRVLHAGFWWERKYNDRVEYMELTEEAVVKIEPWAFSHHRHFTEQFSLSHSDVIDL